MDAFPDRSLFLNEDEALGLLDIVMLCSADLTGAQQAAAVKLSDFCREYLRERRNAVAEPLLARAA